MAASRAPRGKFLGLDAEATPPASPPSTHRRIIWPFLRYANYDCQRKGEMLKAFRERTVLEVGAYLGEEWDDLLTDATHVWSLEPSPGKQAELQKRRDDPARRGKVDLFNMALSSSTGVLKFWVDGVDSQQDTVGRPPPWVSQAEFDAKAIEVNVSTLDDFWKGQMGRRHITMLKMDTQGHEAAIIAGGRELFSTDPPEIIHMEFSPNLAKAAGLDVVPMWEFLYAQGYLCSDCAAFGPPPLDPEKRDIRTYGTNFGHFTFKGVDHGQWADVICLK